MCNICAQLDSEPLDEEVDTEILVADLQAIILQQEQTIRSKNQTIQAQEAEIRDRQYQLAILAENGITLKRRVLLPSQDDPLSSYTYDLEIIG